MTKNPGDSLDDQELAGERPFVSIYEDETRLSSEMEKELAMRYKQVLKNPTDSKSWDDIKADHISR